MCLEVFDLKTEYKVNPIGIAVLSPRLSWKIRSNKKSLIQSSYRVTAAESIEKLQNLKDLVWDSGQVQSDQSIHISYSGIPLYSRQRIYWQVKIWDNYGNTCTSDSVSFWEMGLMSMSDWKAECITPSWPEKFSSSSPCPYFRREFLAKKPVIRARIYASALGLYELQLNGRKVGDRVFTPGWTSYDKRIQYQVYDITSLIRKGKNAIGAILGDGWYRGHLGWWENNRNTYGKQLGLLLQIEIAYDGNETEIIASGMDWKADTGPILSSDIYNGESYDARLEQEGWSNIGFNDVNWKPVKKLDFPFEKLVADSGEKIKKITKLKPVKKMGSSGNSCIVDFGQNVTGWVRIQVNGKKDQVIKLQFAEVLDKEGGFYMANLRKIKCTDTYIFKGSLSEVYEPLFTFHGFRYVKIEGVEENFRLQNITAIVVHSDMEQIGNFSCSDALVNRLFQNIKWSQRGNFLDIPTDCPQRDERLGWTGDAQVFASTACMNFNAASFFGKWLADLALEQREDGNIPWVVPNVIVEGGGTGWSDGYGASGWADAVIIIPWTIYQHYGDKTILFTQYKSMRKWVEYMRLHASHNYIFNHGFHFGDWLSFSGYYSLRYNAPDYGYAGAHTEKDLISTAYFYYSTFLLSKIARILGKAGYADELAECAFNIKKAWNHEFLTSGGRLVSNTQTAYSLALVFDLIDDHLKSKLVNHLSHNIESLEHLTTGFIGTPLLNFALSDHGHINLAVKLLKNTNYPSWLYPVTQGATTIWERWDGIKPDGSFQDEGMNSFNHYAYGAVGAWLYKRLAGITIDPDYPGFKKIIFRPQPVQEFSWVESSIVSMYGLIKISWIRNVQEVTIEIVIPGNCTAKFIIPSGYKINSNILLGKDLLFGSGNHTISLRAE